jgi:hypothetical protein
LGNLNEHTMQVKVVQYVRTFFPEVLILSVPNGAGTSAKNRLALYAEGLLPGVPDLFIPEARKGFHGLWIEMKTQEGVESVAQKRIRNHLEDNNYLCYVARSEITAINIIEAYLKQEENISLKQY